MLTVSHIGSNYAADKNQRKMSFHKSNLGTFGESLTCDIDGYVHTTIKGWMSANVDWGFDRTVAARRNAARDLAERARNEVTAAEAALAEWQKNNR